ncbi:glycosyltransferase [Bradyrhizobium sp. AUGA SZCCT0177]|uniref:glycosyltransferase n=1 Tax=Bradyrhizobium sp. AUGA SZCCT0177 TaxID=2807665 RepID=UPI001BACEEA3|nr:glycosyltransferase [Bradyrhizobium sp. AUGA SZCCT0177]MBR1286154.1 glycosyltransferase [Bradyrhizobium sp. AUGA SZCCT0177]
MNVKPDAAKGDVIFTIGTLEVGGTELHLASVAAGLVSRGWNVSIYSLAGEGPLARSLTESGVNIICPPIKRDGRPAPMIVRFIRFSIVSGHLFTVLVRRRPAIVHCFLPMAYLTTAPLAFLTGIRIRVMSRRSLNHYQGKYPLLRGLERRLHGHMTAILGNSRRVLGDLTEEGVDERRLGLIYNGVDLKRVTSKAARNETRGALGISADALVMIVVANLIPYKGHLDLISALGGAAALLPRDWQLLIVGRDDGAGAAIGSLAVELGIGDHIRFLGSRSDVPDLIAASDLGVLPSHEEGFSNAVIEQMAAGLCVVATDVGGNAEAILDRTTGVIVPPRDVDALSRAIVQLVGDPALRSRFGSAAQARVQSNFTLDACVAGYESLYRGLLGGKRVCDIEEVRASGNAGSEV